MRAVGIGMVVLAALGASPAMAQFDRPTQCTGLMRFYNEDGTFSLYDMQLDLDQAIYRIQAVNQEDGEANDDRGRCAAYLGEGCRHIVSAAGEDPEVYYDFDLSARGGDRYLYSENWSDGFSGNTLLTCRATSGN